MRTTARRRSGRFVPGGAIVVLSLAVGFAATPHAEETSALVTFHGDVAPILFEHCAPCHRPGGSAPFALLTYRDAVKRARQIVDVTRTRFMPPWLPAQSHVPLVGERRLGQAELATLRRWVEDGAVEGDSADAPDAPRWPEGWQLGQPDLVLRMQGYELPAEGVDVYRNFVLPADASTTRWVRAVEFRPDNPRVVHHATLLVDRSGVSRHLDAQDAQPGFAGMSVGSAETPDGILVGWTPGKLPVDGADGLAWRLDPRTDVVVQLHMVPTGKPEPVGCQVGLHFAEAPPTRQAFALLLGTREIDIPAGDSDYAVTDSYTLPVDVDLLGIYPHAHYLGRSMRANARLPDGELLTLLHIPEWDFNWQDEYRYVEPIHLPAGSELSMDYTYDNSSDNVRNPNQPPRRVRYGARSADEMAELLLQVVPRTANDLARLQADYQRHKVVEAIAFRRRRAAEEPDNPSHFAAMGSSYLVLGDLGSAIRSLSEAARLDPDDAQVQSNLGFALASAGRVDEAIERYRRAVRIDPGFPEAHMNLALALQSREQHGEALDHFERTVRILPQSVPAWRALAAAYASAGQLDRALVTARRALELATGTPLADAIRREVADYERALASR